jgi:transcriptional regulator with XRE-family HTH domain
MGTNGCPPDEPAEPPAPPGRLPATLYERWRTALHIDGVAYGKRVRELREERGWTLVDVYERTGVPVSTLSELESGRSARPQVALNMTLAQTFGFEHPGALLGVPQPPRPPGTHPSGPRMPPGGPEPVPGLAVEAERLLTGLLRGLWTAQDERGERRGRVTRLVTLSVGLAELDEEPAPAPPAPPADPPAAD